MDVVSFPDYDLLWSDPPWDNTAFWDTIYKKHTGKKTVHTNDGIYSKLFSLAHKNKPMLIEYSIHKDYNSVISLAEHLGHKNVQKITVTQSNGKPQILLLFNTDYRLKDGLKGFDNITNTVKEMKPKQVFDAFGGIGQTANAFLRAGADYIGYELNPERYKRLKAVIDNWR